MSDASSDPGWDSGYNNGGPYDSYSGPDAGYDPRDNPKYDKQNRQEIYVSERRQISGPRSLLKGCLVRVAAFGVFSAAILAGFAGCERDREEHRPPENNPDGITREQDSGCQLDRAGHPMTNGAGCGTELEKQHRDELNQNKGATHTNGSMQDGSQIPSRSARSIGDSFSIGL